MWYLPAKCRDDIAELFCPPHVVPEARKRSLQASLSIDLVTGYDLRIAEDRKRANHEFQEANPRLLLTGPPWSAMSQLQNLSPPSHHKEVKLSEGINMLESAMDEQEKQLERKWVFA
ncbi:unnamed protein product [Polarella glacialis]|uniref:Uncharacterized protein n=1 Tax=Polarella glacialis TaxID=89957 RepID=A0A813D8U9_POLGL|nr:unnamed protein product [Polarella glacialis]